MIEKVINRKNIRKAYLQVRANKGSAGVDGMTVNDLPKFLKEQQDKIATAIGNGKYLPQPILGVEIPKSNGKRLLGVPTVVDRVLQQAVSQVIGPKFEAVRRCDTVQRTQLWIQTQSQCLTGGKAISEVHQ